jgi:hypothetical protein
VLQELAAAYPQGLSLPGCILVHRRQCRHWQCHWVFDFHTSLHAGAVIGAKERPAGCRQQLLSLTLLVLKKVPTAADGILVLAIAALDS